MFLNPVHFCRNSVVMNLVLGSVELMRSDGGMFRICRGSCSVDVIEEKALFSKGSVSKYGKVSCLSYIWVRTGLIGGVCIKIVNVLVCVVGHGGYGAFLMFDLKPVSRDGMNLILFSSGVFQALVDLL